MVLFFFFLVVKVFFNSFLVCFMCGLEIVNFLGFIFDMVIRVMIEFMW